MELSKTIINVLIVTAILLIGVSVTSVLMKKPSEAVNVPLIPAQTTNEPVVEETTAVSTTTNSTTTDTNTNASASSTTSTSSSAIISNKNFIDKKWTWVRTTISGTSTAPKKANSFSLTFNATGTLSGTTDCNSYFGSYKLTSTNLSFGPLGSTKMFCEGSQENDFMNVLQKVSGYVIDSNNNLVLSTGSGTMVFK